MAERESTSSTPQGSRTELWRAIVSGARRGVAPTLARVALGGLSWPYACATAIRNWLYDRGWKRTERAGVPVVSIGNLTVGGTGKTPAVEYVSRFYRECDRRVAILSRGYGQVAGRNDEALVLEENLPDVPHLQGVDRVALARIAVEELESEVLVLDDGFQHRRLARDLDIALIDATEPWGRGWQLPRGLLRESPRGLRRASLAMITRCDLAAPPVLAEIRRRIEKLSPGLAVVESLHRPDELINAEGRIASIAELDQRPVLAFCGIGNPAAFQGTLLGLGANVEALTVFPDHHRYQRADVERLAGWVRDRGQEALVITTQKDLVKLRLSELGGRPLWALRVKLQPTVGRETLDRMLRGILE